MSQTKAQLIDGKSATIQFTGGSASAPSVSFTGDTNTGIYSPGADQLALSTNGTGRLFVDASGRVGINTSTPERSLGLWSATNDDGIQIRNTSSAASVNKNSRLQFVGTDTVGTAKGTANIYCLAADQDLVGAHLSFWTRGSDVNAERLRITSAGLVGIGTSSPLQLLQLNSAAATNSTLAFSENGTLKWYNRYNASDGSFQIVDVVNTTTRLHITNTGNVGIGTTSPDALLHLSLANTTEPATGTLPSGIGVSFGATNGSNAGLWFSGDFGVSNQGYCGIAGARDSGFSTSLRFYTNDATSSYPYAERARIDSSGRLLVGTSSSRGSGLPLQIASDSTGAVEMFRGSSSADSATSLIFSRSRGSTASPSAVSSGDTLGYLFYSGYDGSNYTTAARITAEVDGTPGTNDMPGRLVFSTCPDGSASPVERWRIDSSGSLVGVAGSAFVAPYVYNTTTATAANVNVDATGFLRRSTSSIKYKINVETIQDQYADAILGCRPVWYQSTCEADKPEWGHWGFIAEEVAEIDPRLCFFKEEEDGTLEPEGVQYDRFVPHLLNLIKRQGEAIAELQAEVAALKVQ